MSMYGLKERVSFLLTTVAYYMLHAKLCHGTKQVMGSFDFEKRANFNCLYFMQTSYGFTVPCE